MWHVGYTTFSLLCAYIFPPRKNVEPLRSVRSLFGLVWFCHRQKLSQRNLGQQKQNTSARPAARDQRKNANLTSGSSTTTAAAAASVSLVAVCFMFLPSLFSPVIHKDTFFCRCLGDSAFFVRHCLRSSAQDGCHTREEDVEARGRDLHEALLIFLVPCANEEGRNRKGLDAACECTSACLHTAQSVVGDVKGETCSPRQTADRKDELYVEG
ncbi:gamma-tubulin complex component, putative [Anopheles sinensis]|uniref:Gamma-tubulin complex component, putative n=1 Tax=Anopheles sinensis TaxID=74873 RepID=A0A084VPH2_ANOSI|nr:gamma-tubulin complex component, putative [Anopheles sinensis]